MVITKLSRVTMLACVLFVALGGSIASADIVLSFTGRGGTPALMKFQAGLAALKAKDLAAAEAAFKESLKLDAKVVGSMLGLAQVALSRGDAAGARKLVEEAVASVPESSEAHLNLGRMLYAERNFAGAEASFKNAVARDSSSVTALMDLADLYMSGLGKPAEAIPHYRAALKLSPQHGGAQYALGVALMATGATAEGEKALLAAVGISPKNPLPRAALGQLYISMKQPDKAMETYNAALVAMPDVPAFLVARGQLHMARNNDPSALADFAAASKAAPKAAEPHLRTGMIHQRNRRWAEAQTAYLAAVKVDAGNAVAYNNLAWMTVERNAELERGLGWAKQAVALDAKSPSYQDTLGWVQRARGDLKGAEAVLEKAAAAKPERAGVLYHLGVVRQELGKRAEAVDAFRRALTIDSAFSDAADARARMKTLGA